MSASTPELSVLIVDDSAVYRMVLQRVLGKISDVKVVGRANNGKAAIDQVKALKPDLVTLDMEMPEMNGLQALKEIKKIDAQVQVLMVAGSTPDSAKQTMEALQAGALDFVVKPQGGKPEESEAALVLQLEEAIAACRERLNKTAPRIVPRQNTAPLANQVENKLSEPRMIDVVLLGASTGGPNAIETVVGHLPKQLPVPVLVVVHMPPVFTASYAQGLNNKGGIQVKEVADGMLVEPGGVYIAQGGKHMVVRKELNGQRKLYTNLGAPENSCRPAVDVLFRSGAEAYLPERTLCVILTGMGADGVEGVRYLRSRGGGYLLTQSAKSCVVYGMPRSVDEAQLTNEVVELSDMGARISKIARKGRI